MRLFFLLPGQPMPTLEKRDFSEQRRQHLAHTHAALPDGSFPIVSRKDLSNAIRAIGRAKDPEAAKRHICQRAKALGATDMLPEEWGHRSMEKAMNGGPEEAQQHIRQAIGHLDAGVPNRAAFERHLGAASRHAGYGSPAGVLLGAAAHAWRHLGDLQDVREHLVGAHHAYGVHMLETGREGTPHAYETPDQYLQRKQSLTKRADVTPETVFGHLRSAHKALSGGIAAMRPHVLAAMRSSKQTDLHPETRRAIETMHAILLKPDRNGTPSQHASSVHYRVIAAAQSLRQHHPAPDLTKALLSRTDHAAVVRGHLARAEAVLQNGDHETALAHLGYAREHAMKRGIHPAVASAVNTAMKAVWLGQKSHDKPQEALTRAIRITHAYHPESDLTKRFLPF